MDYRISIFHRVKELANEPKLCLVISIIFALCAGILVGLGHAYTMIPPLLISIAYAMIAIKSINRLRNNVNYLISASTNGDFSYKFPLEGISKYERNVNRMLNVIVEHLEKLCENAREDEVFLGKIIDILDTGIIVADDNGHIIQCNKAARRLLDTHALTEIKQLPEEIAGVEIKKFSTQLRQKNISICTLTDVSRIMQTAEVDSWERLTRVLTHEVMNSLTPVNSIANSLSQYLEENNDSINPDIRHQIEVIKSSNLSLMDFVKNFRKITVLPEPKFQIFYLKPYLENIVSLAKAFNPSADLEFRLIVFPPDMMIYTDGNMLSRVLLNILKNAVEADSRHISIDVDLQEDEGIAISISNDGTLIPQDIANQIFTPFFTTKAEGTGIGLSLSRRIISRLGGTINLTTKPTTRFVIIL